MNRPILDPFAWSVALFISGLTAGMFLMDFLGYYPVLPRLSDQTAIDLHQKSVVLRRVAFRVAIATSSATSLLLAIFFSDGATRRLLIMNLISLAAFVAYTNRVLVPLNREIATWNAASPPPSWQLHFAKMIALERIRSFLPALAFMLELIGFTVRFAK